MSAATSFSWDGNAVRWRGLPSYQLPSDLIRYQEIITERRPHYVIETGPGEGGTTLFLRDACRAGCVVPVNDSLTNFYAVRDFVGTCSVMAVLDSDVYSRDHMALEIAVYAQLVTIGQHLIVCHTDREDWGAKPALDAYLADHGHKFAVVPPPMPSMATYLERIIK